MIIRFLSDTTSYADKLQGSLLGKGKFADLSGKIKDKLKMKTFDVWTVVDQKAAGKTKTPTTLELGEKLDRAKTLDLYGVKDGSFVYVKKKGAPPNKPGGEVKKPAAKKTATPPPQKAAPPPPPKKETPKVASPPPPPPPVVTEAVPEPVKTVSPPKAEITPPAPPPAVPTEEKVVQEPKQEPKQEPEQKPQQQPTQVPKQEPKQQETKQEPKREITPPAPAVVKSSPPPPPVKDKVVVDPVKSPEIPNSGSMSPAMRDSVMISEPPLVSKPIDPATEAVAAKSRALPPVRTSVGWSSLLDEIDRMRSDHEAEKEARARAFLQERMTLRAKAEELHQIQDHLKDLTGQALGTLLNNTKTSSSKGRSSASPKMQQPLKRDPRDQTRDLREQSPTGTSYFRSAGGDVQTRLSRVTEAASRADTEISYLKTLKLDRERKQRTFIEENYPAGRAATTAKDIAIDNLAHQMLSIPLHADVTEDDVNEAFIKMLRLRTIRDEALLCEMSATGTVQDMGFACSATPTLKGSAGIWHPQSKTVLHTSPLRLQRQEPPSQPSSPPHPQGVYRQQSSSPPSIQRVRWS